MACISGTQCTEPKLPDVTVTTTRKKLECLFKGRSHGHRNAHRMRIQSGFSIHMNPNWNLMRIAFNPPREVVWKRIETGSYYYS